MHILLIHQAFASLNEAGGTRHHEIARQLATRGHKVTVLTGQVSYLTGEKIVNPGWVRREVDDLGVEILRTYVYRGWHRSFFHRIFSFISFMISSFLVGLGRKKVDVVWGTSPPLFQGFTAWILARLKGAKFLFEVRDLWPKFAVSVGVLRNPILIRLSRGLERFLYRNADRIVINSPGFRNHVLDRGARNVELIPNGVDTDMFSPEMVDADFGDQAELIGKFVVTYAGAHGESNDLDVILGAASKLCDNKEIRFVLIGDGKEKASLIEKSKNMGLENIFFYSSVSKVKMPGILASADVCVAILKPIDAFKTTYPNKVFDYMAAGKPVLLAIDGVIRDVVEAAGGGIFVPPGNSEALASAVEEMWQNPKEVKRMGASGREYVKVNFDRSKQVEALIEVIQELNP
jgi:glycosyltransferase involved in cell wall biosynthesis